MRPPRRPRGAAWRSVRRWPRRRGARGSRDDRLDAGHVTRAARLAVTTWVQAVDGDDTALTAMAVLQAAGPWPWRLASGHVQTLDEFLGYTFISRQETPGQYAERTGSLEPPQAAGPARRFRLTAGFFEHDVRFGSSVTIEVQREAAPARDEAVQLVWPAVEQETTRALGDGDRRPSLSSLKVVELPGG